MKNNNKLKEIIKYIFFGLCIGFLILLVFSLSSCRTVYVSANLPVYKLDEIERPSIAEKSEDVIKLMRYAEKKEIQLNNFYEFYESLRAGQK